MIKWLNKISSPLSADSSPRNVGRADILSTTSRAKWTSAYASDPSEWERLFDAKWKIVDSILEKKLVNVEHEVDFDEMMALIENATNMCTLLMLEVNSQPEPSIGPILDRFFTEQIMERILDWVIQLPTLLKPSCQLAIVRIYENIVSESHSQNHCLLVHKPILNPLLRLLFHFGSRRADAYYHQFEGRKTELSATEKHFVLLLNQICTKLAEDKTLLHFFFHCANGSEQFIVFTQLITFLYEQNDIGQLARDALLLILSVSSDHDAIAQFVAYRTAFCPVVATGLSGCFSQLPRSIHGDGGERWVDDEFSDSLSDFHSSILFCNAVAQAAHPAVVAQISKYFYSGFLIPVVKPALLQDDRQYIAASLAYLQLCLETITEPVLIRAVVELILTERDENGTLLFERIMNYMKSGDKASIVAISLTDTLIQLCCEDVMLAFVFRPLLTNHVANKKQLSKVHNRIRCSTFAQKYLDCIPKCIMNYKEVCSQTTLAEYIDENRLKMDARSDQCRSWKWKYDGVVADSFCLPSESDDDATCHVPFSRLSSSRSSMSMATHGLNRYIHSSSHLSYDFNIEKVCALGEKQKNYDDVVYEDINSYDIDDIEEDNHFILPQIDEMTTSKVMSSSCLDYLHISGLDDFSESDDSAPIITEGETTDPDSGTSFVLSGWQDVKDEETWRSLLEKQKVKGKLMNFGEITSFIDEKMKELKSREEQDEPEGDEKNNAEKNEAVEVRTTGFSVYQFSERSTLLKFIFDSIETLCENSISFNVEICCLVSNLATYPQPILAYYLFDVKEDKSEKCLLSILSNVQTRIEVMAEGIEGFDIWIQRALKSMEARAARIQRQCVANTKSPREESSFFSRSFGGSFRKPPSFSLHTHKHIDSMEVHRDDATAKQTAFAAIFLAHLSQIFASIVLQQSVVC
ncbi:unnamed protein product [Caenorhabditis bovis]|uniref:FHF complex subunit HOOK-interacting protein C-terminal domain-containing protein n=1 Tax=Caenorhabditis bovis TaxID=2654633 RepID=A0A8S1EJH4_9PELO|nr:unnamed protein product [Caenorhabditis bovis]